MSLTISPAHIEILKAHCSQCWPEEACALLVGHKINGNEDNVTRVVLAKNVAVDRLRFFEIDPAVRIRLEKELRENESDSIVGVFHSHPNGPASPSISDEKMVIERQFYWLIAAAEKGELVELNAYKPRAETGFSAVQLNIDNK